MMRKNLEELAMAKISELLRSYNQTGIAGLERKGKPHAYERHYRRCRHDEVW
jgi:hypothetical protein